jgi:hypothetical protein
VHVAVRADGVVGPEVSHAASVRDARLEFAAARLGLILWLGLRDESCVVDGKSRNCVQ